MTNDLSKAELKVTRKQNNLTITGGKEKLLVIPRTPCIQLFFKNLNQADFQINSTMALTFKPILLVEY